jgi:hypothetical protein
VEEVQHYALMYDRAPEMCGMVFTRSEKLELVMAV